jgi:hypothetical membrane protein
MPVDSRSDVRQTSVDQVATPPAALAIAGMAAPLLFIALVILQGLLQPDYSHLKQPISALTAWPAGWLQRLNFYVVGGLMTAFAFGLNNGVRQSPRGFAGFVLLVIGAIGIALAGVFPWRLQNGVPTETPQHVVAAVMVFAATPLALIVFSRRMKADPRWRELAGYTLVTGIVMALLFPVMGLLAIPASGPLHPWAGLLQRVICAIWFACILVLAVRLRTISSPQPTDDEDPMTKRTKEVS